jgi:branched-chain amino acid transport system permease protein
MRTYTPPFGYRTLLAIIALAFALLPLIANKYILFVGNVTFVFVLLSIGLNLLLGYTGLLAFVNGALFGVGAYITAIMRTQFDLPYWLALPTSAIGALVIGVIVALPALRLSGLYLALATVAFAQTMQWVFLHWDAVTGGPTGIIVKPIAYPVLGPDLGHYYVSLAVTVIAAVLVMNLLRSRIGRAFVAIRESEVGAQSLAIDLTRFKTMAYAVSAFLAGLAGGLFSPMLGLAVPESYDLFQVIIQFAMVIVGGLGSILGAVIGAVALVWIQEMLRAFRELQEIAFGGMILLTILFLPGGVAGLLRRFFPSWREPFHRSGGERP